MKNITKIYISLFLLYSAIATTLTAQVEISEEVVQAPRKNIFMGYHIGVVQPLYAFNDGTISHLFNYRDYSIGMAIGLSLKTPGSAIIDLEMVPFISQLPDEGIDLKVHLLYHPGVLIPLGRGFTFGTRLAFETSRGQWGFTPLLNKSFKVGTSKVFLEIVAPGRFGPGVNSQYRQMLGVHAGYGFFNS